MNSKQFEAALADADTRLSRLRALYEQWFAGVERLEPTQQRDAFEKLMKALRNECPNNTAARFRQQQLTQRYVTYTTYWRRVARQIEEGTYHRDVVKARRRKELRSQVRERRESLEIDIDLDMDMDMDMDSILNDAQALCDGVEQSQQAVRSSPTDDAASRTFGVPQSERPAALPAGLKPISAPHAPKPPRSPSVTASGAPVPPQAAAPPRPAAAIPPFPAAVPAPPTAQRSEAPAGPRSAVPAVPRAAANARPASPRPTPAARPAPPSAAASKSSQQLSEQQIRAIYDRYVAARKSNAERVDNVKLATIEKSVRAMMPKLARKHAGKAIDFDVVVVGGKVALKPVAK